MNKNNIKIFATESRRKLMDDIEYQMNLLGIINTNEILEPSKKAEGMESYNSAGVEHKIYDNEIKQRESLVKEVKSKGYENVIEEVAYTWFNRIIAIRYMEVNDYLPTRTRVLSSEIEGKLEPDIITYALDLDLNYTLDDKEKIFKFNEENKLDELFQFLFIKQCNKLNEILPELFEKTSDYSEILLNISFTDSDSIINHLINDIPEEDFKDQVEIIGWMYQYYNAELKDETFRKSKKSKKIPKENVPAVTQLFTPKWIVKYMVENSLGRMWIEGHDNLHLKEKWKHYCEDNNQHESVNVNLKRIKENYSQLKIENINIIDPCMGSGHILVYTFDILMDIYLSLGYSKKDATVKILKNNIYGLDVDDRAYQLTYFVILMKARKYNRKILNLNINPMLFSIQESNNVSDEFINYIIEKYPKIKNDLKYLIEIFTDAKEYGSLLNVKAINFHLIKECLEKINLNKNFDLIKFNEEKKLIKILADQGEILSNKYSIVITNPPYMKQENMDNKLNNFVNKYYPLSKANLCTVFIEKCNQMLKLNGLCSMITQQSFMFLKTFKDLREKFLKNTLINMIHLGPNAFDEIGGEVVQTTSFVYLNQEIKKFKTKYFNLVDFNSESTKENAFLNNKNVIYNTFNENFSNIPGSPIAYWADKQVLIFLVKELY
ncbi:hypothetical protein BGI41_00850 [Methanobrevibacter sp. 87.7]|uniref:BREX-1 system adenine-specific DNA-methyltransferase PglX n=1 Tax=Methanobrevibacter sp. 87.7 TaxID=387957 RepID=UPI000B503C07|nr:BREX-1 system adenine-specific DNA-methyltransferase PglX [Methanobrevibacter sp. 87.7]OWT33742.1 hypothetical protein BGI41_00850 [Methanobrevibacter sp. 87.7]